jgi:hypothetical protein
MEFHNKVCFVVVAFHAVFHLANLLSRVFHLWVKVLKQVYSKWGKVTKVTSWFLGKLQKECSIHAGCGVKLPKLPKLPVIWLSDIHRAKRG